MPSRRAAFPAAAAVGLCQSWPCPALPPQRRPGAAPTLPPMRTWAWSLASFSWFMMVSFICRSNERTVRRGSERAPQAPPPCRGEGSVSPPARPPRPPCLQPGGPLPAAGEQPPAQRLLTAPHYLPGAGVALPERRDRSGRGASPGTARGGERDGGRKGGTPRRTAHAPLSHPSGPAGGALTRGGAGRVSGGAGSVHSAQREGPRPGGSVATTVEREMVLGEPPGFIEGRRCLNGLATFFYVVTAPVNKGRYHLSGLQ